MSALWVKVIVLIAISSSTQIVRLLVGIEVEYVSGTGVGEGVGVGVTVGVGTTLDVLGWVIKPGPHERLPIRKKMETVLAKTEIR